jgi:hypothetical protein
MMLSAYMAFFLLSGRMAKDRGTDFQAPWRLDLLPGATQPIDLSVAGHHLIRFSFGYGLLLAIPLAGLLVAGVLLAVDHVV